MKRTVTVIGIALGSALILFSLIMFVNNRFVLKEKTVMAGFKILMDKKEVTAAEIIKYVDENINAVSKENASMLVIGLERIQQADLPKWQEKFENDAFQQKIAQIYRENGWSLADLGRNIQDSDLKTIVFESAGSGFKLETAEGFFFPVIDYDFYQKYHDVVTPDLADYLEIMAVESGQTPVKDAALMIGWDEILKRATRQERFIKEYSTSTQVEAMRQLLKRYTTFALFGANNTPLFSYDSKQMLPEAKETYSKYPFDKKNGSFSALMIEYLRVLEKNDYRLTTEVDNYRKNVAASF